MINLKADWRTGEDCMLNCDFAISAIREARASLVDELSREVLQSGSDDNSSAKAGARWKDKMGLFHNEPRTACRALP